MKNMIKVIKMIKRIGWVGWYVVGWSGGQGAHTVLGGGGGGGRMGVGKGQRPEQWVAGSWEMGEYESGGVVGGGRRRRMERWEGG